MWHKSTKEEAASIAREKTQLTGTDYRVVEVKGMFAVGTYKKVAFHYPEALGWNFYYQC